MARTLLRESGDGHAEVGHAELFFDLVYVFAVTQLSHFLLEHHDAVGLLQTIILFLAVWWAWIYTVWATNWLDPERGAVRIMIFVAMLVGLVMSATIPDAFGERGIWFALTYIGAQILRTAWLAFVMRGPRPVLSKNLFRVMLWFILSAPFWIGGALADPSDRLWLWAIGIVLNIIGPIVQFWLPGLGASRTQDYEVSGAHMAERCALLIIIALGEYLLLAGATFAGLPWTAERTTNFVAGFMGSVLLWWIYFDLGAKRGAELIAHHRDTGRVARDAYTYTHIPIVAGIIVAAVGDEMGLSEPSARTDPLFLWTAIGGPALFLGGTMLFKRLTSGRPWFPLSHVVGLSLLALVALWGWIAEPTRLQLGLAISASLLIVAIWEWVSFHGGWVERGVPEPEFLRRRAERKLARAEESRHPE